MVNYIQILCRPTCSLQFTCSLQCRYYFVTVYSIVLYFLRLESIDRNLARACGTLLPPDACRDLRGILGAILQEFRSDSGEQPLGNPAGHVQLAVLVIT